MEKEIQQTLDGELIFQKEKRDWEVKVNKWARQEGILAVGVSA